MVNSLAVNVKSNIYIEIISKGFEKIRKNVKEVTNEFRGFSTVGEMATKRIEHLNESMKVYGNNIKILETTQRRLNRTLQSNIKRVAEFGNQALRGEITTKQFNDKTKRLLTSQMALKTKIDATTMAIKNYKGAMNRTDKQIRRLGTETKNTEKKMDQFHAELLSVMFFGMAMSAALSGMTQRAKESSGALELWGSAMETLFLPIMEEVLPYMEEFADDIDDMDTGTKKSVGGLVLLWEVLSKLIMSLGMLGLAWFGFTQMAQTYPELAKKIGKVTKWLLTPLRMLWRVGAWVFGRLVFIIAGFSATVTSVLLGIFIFLLIAWKKDWGNMRKHFDDTIEGIKTVARGVGKVLSGIFKIGLGLVKVAFTDEWDLVTEGWQNFTDGLGDIADGAVKAIWSPWKWLWDMLKDFMQYFKDLKDEISDVGLGGTFANRIGSKVGGAMDWLAGLSPYAEGGIVTRPTAALIGEAGPEAVIPLNKMGGMGTTININNPVVRNDTDINAIAEQVSRVLEDNRRRFR